MSGLRVIFDPDVAQEHGIPGAILHEAIRYWATKPEADTARPGWVYYSIPMWAARFPFLSESTIRRALATLEAAGLIEKQFMEVRSGLSCYFYRLCQNDRGGGQNEQGGVVKMTIPTRDLQETVSIPPVSPHAPEPEEQTLLDGMAEKWQGLGYKHKPEAALPVIRAIMAEYPEVDYLAVAGDLQAAAAGGRKIGNWLLTFRNWCKTASRPRAAPVYSPRAPVDRLEHDPQQKAQ